MRFQMAHLMNWFSFEKVGAAGNHGRSTIAWFSLLHGPISCNLKAGATINWQYQLVQRSRLSACNFERIR